MFGPPFDAWSSATGDVGTPAPAPAPAQTDEPVAAQPAPPPAADPVALPPPSVAPSSTRTGFAVVLVGIGAAVGWVAGGPWGAGAGALWVGAARNGLRSRAEWQTDRAAAAKTATLAVLGAAIGGYLTYRAYQSRTGLAALE